MTCRKFQKFLLEESDLSASQQQSLSAHLKSCAACREFRAQLNTLSQQFESLLPVPDPRKGFTGRVLANIPFENNSQASWLEELIAFIQPAPAVLAFASLALGVFLASQMRTIIQDQAPQDPQIAIFTEFFDATPLLAFDQSSTSTFKDQER